MRIGPFSIEKNECFTECECPDHLCVHGSSRMRPYYIWIVWDEENDEHASISRRDGGFSYDYDLRADAISDVRRYLERNPA